MVGTDVGGYSIESVLGRGAMGVVYVARQRSPERRVALKLIHPAFAGDDTFRRRFLREATAAAAIEHPHILPVYAAGESDGILFLATRLIDGLDLRETLRESAGLAPERAAGIVGQIGEALDAAHARGLVHRDVKPGNILIARTSGEEDGGFCYLMDFGVSMWTASSAATITTTGRMVGTADYVAPEQVEGGAIDGRADQYSLGCLLYECLTGRTPFAGRNPPATLYAHLHEEAPPPSAIRPDLAAAVDAVVARALRKTPQERYASCRELTQDLRAALAGSTATPKTTLRVAASRRPPVPPPRLRRAAGVAVATVLIVAAAGFAFAGFRGRTTPQESSSPSIAPPQLIREGVGVTASNTAQSSTDASGNAVTYVPAKVVDGDVQTAWRTPGDGRGEWVTLIFENPIDVVRIGLIPGYAKTDPETGANRFLQDRIITSVRYLIPGLPRTTQTFRPVPEPQFVSLHATTSLITVKILGTTEPGGLDYTAISEIYVYGYRQ